MVKRGRSARGEKKPWAELTEKQVLEIKRLISVGVRQTTIAQLFNVHKTTINAIHKGRAWKHI
jgi:IS30 family transposase